MPVIEPPQKRAGCNQKHTEKTVLTDNIHARGKLMHTKKKYAVTDNTHAVILCLSKSAESIKFISGFTGKMLQTER